MVAGEGFAAAVVAAGVDAGLAVVFEVVAGAVVGATSFEYSTNANVNGCSGPSFVILTFATSVVAALVKKYRIAPGRIAAIGYAEFQPIAPNDSNENRAKNRRVDFVLSLAAPLPPEELMSEASGGVPQDSAQN